MRDFQFALTAKPGAKTIKLRDFCPHYKSQNIILGAGRKPGESSHHCENCQRFLGYSPVARLRAARKRKELTECLQILESQGIKGNLALFALSLADDNGGES